MKAHKRQRPVLARFKPNGSVQELMTSVLLSYRRTGKNNCVNAIAGLTVALLSTRCRMGPTNRGSTGCDLSRLEDVVEHVPSRLENGGLPGPFPRVTLGAHFGRRDTGPDGADRRDPTGHRLDAT